MEYFKIEVGEKFDDIFLKMIEAINALRYDVVKLNEKIDRLNLVVGDNAIEITDKPG